MKDILTNGLRRVATATAMAGEKILNFFQLEQNLKIQFYSNDYGYDKGYNKGGYDNGYGKGGYGKGYDNG